MSSSETNSLFGKTETTTAAIEHAHSRAAAQRDIAAALAQAGRFEQAQTTAAAIEVDYQRAAAQRDIAVALAQAGRSSEADNLFEQAQITAAAIENADSRAEDQRYIAAALAQAGRWLGSGGAFAVLGMRITSDYVGAVATWSQAGSFEKLEAGLFVRLLVNILRIAAWEDSTWKPVADMLEDASLH